MHHKNLSTVVKYLWGLFLFTFPFSIRFLVYDQAAYRFGHFNPWVSAFIYLPEILLITTFGLWAFLKWKEKWKVPNFKTAPWILLGLFVLNAVVVTFVRGDAVLAFAFLLRMIEGVMLYLLLIDKILPTKQMISLLLVAVLLQLLWGFGQYQFNHSLGLGFLGEQALGPEVANVAKVDLPDGTQQIRAYGSFLHPNILAAYFLIIYFLALPYLKWSGKLFWYGLLMVGLFITESQAAFVVAILGAALGIVFSLTDKFQAREGFAYLLILLLFLGNGWLFYNSASLESDNFSFQARFEQNAISQQMWQAEPLGVGARNFTLEMEQFSERKLLPWEIQPVHNNYFLILNETGTQGLLLFLIALGWYILKLAPKHPLLPLFILLFLAPFDHFLWDSWVGLMLVALTLGFLKLEHA